MPSVDRSPECPRPQRPGALGAARADSRHIDCIVSLICGGWLPHDRRFVAWPAVLKRARPAGTPAGCPRTQRRPPCGDVLAFVDLVPPRQRRARAVVRPAWAPARGCKSPVDQMTETTSRWQLRRREAGWEGSRRRTRGPRNTNRVEGGAIRASQQRVAKPVSSRDRNVNAAGVRRRLVPLSGETCWDVGLDASRPTPVAERRPVTRQESAEAVVAAGSCAAKGQTRSRGKARPCSRKPHGSQPRSGGAFAQWMHRVKPEAPREEQSGFPAPGTAEPHPADAKDLWEEFLSRENLAAALRRVERNAGAPGVDGVQAKELRPWLHDHWPEVRACSTRAPTGRNPPGGSRSQSPPEESGSWGCRRPWIE